ncbi:MAG: arginine--tRNA ligase [Dehalococcoidia bacterium]
MIKDDIAALVERAALAAQDAGEIPQVDLPDFQVERPQRPEHGDYAVNLPLKLARPARANPMALAQAIAERIPADGLIAAVDVAPPGFLNFRLQTSWLAGQVGAILDAGEQFGRSEMGAGQSVQVEFVSANPTGPPHVGNGRGAVIGSVLADALALAGYTTQREYYVNDAGTQADRFGRTLLARYEQLFGRDAAIPEDGYPGAYMIETAEALKERHGARFLDKGEELLAELTSIGIDLMVERIAEDMRLLGVEYDRWFRESSLYEDRAEGSQWDRAFQILKDGGHIEERDGAVWFASSQLGEDKDNVVIRSDGRPAYLASDIAYHLDKFTRFDQVINVWGADHQGHVRRMKSAVAALGFDPDKLDILIYQLVTLKRGDEVMRLSKRAGDIITLREVIEEVGRDACRFFFLSRSADAQMEFDLELAKRESTENPVYYVQYAHARIASVLEFARDRIPEWADADILLLGQPTELALIRKMLEFPEVVELVCRQHAPHHLPHYSQELATAYHSFYTESRVVTDDIPLSKARLRLCEAAKLVLARSLTLMGVSAPAKM